MTTKAALHRLVEALPDEELPAAEWLLVALRAGRHDPLLQALLTAPVDDEATTPEEDAGAAEAREEYRQGEYVPAGEAKRRLLA